MEQIKKTLDMYANERIPTGGFLRACLENDLSGAFAKADFQNRYILFEIVSYMYNHVPAESWGSKEKVKKWLNE